jgi:hypothetical protein
MTTRRDFLKALGVGAAVAVLPAVAVKAEPNLLPNSDFMPWIKGPEYPRTVLATADARYDDTTIHVDAGERLSPNGVILNVRTRENFLVTDIRREKGRTRITALRGIGGFPVSVSKGDVLMLISSGLEAL